MRFLSFSVLAVVSMVGIAHAAPQYSLTDYGQMIASTGASALNDGGQIVGARFDSIAGRNRPTISDPVHGVQTLFDWGFDAYANGVSASGTVVGNLEINAVHRIHPYVWRSGTGVQDIDPDLNTKFGGPGNSYVYGIDDLGNALGVWVAASGPGGAHGFSYDTSTGSVTDIGSLGYGGTQAFAGQGGKVVGFSNGSAGWLHAFSWDATHGMTDLGTDGALVSAATDVNASGTVSGYVLEVSTFTNQAFVWNTGTGIQRLNFLGGYDSSLANAIGDNGLTVGMMVHSVDGSSVACSWDGSGNALDLNAALDGTGTGYTLTGAYSIDAQGRIMAQATLGGVSHTVLLTPVPEPASMAVLGLGLAAAVRRRKRA